MGDPRGCIQWIAGQRCSGVERGRDARQAAVAAVEAALYGASPSEDLSGELLEWEAVETIPLRRFRNFEGRGPGMTLSGYRLIPSRRCGAWRTVSSDGRDTVVWTDWAEL